MKIITKVRFLFCNSAWEYKPLSNYYMSSFGEIGTLPLGDTTISSIDFSPIDDYFAAGTLDQQLYVWNASFEPLDKNPVMKKDDHIMGIVDVKFNHKGTHIVASCLDSNIRNWEIITQELKEIVCQPLENYKVAIRDRQVITTGELGRLAFFNMESGEKVKQLKTEEIFSTAIASSSKNSYISTGNNNGTMFIFNLNNNDKMGKYQLHHKMIRSLAFTDNESKIISASEDQTIKVFDVQAEKAIAELNGHKLGVTAVDSHPIDEKLLVSASLDKTIKFWDMRTKNSTGSITYHTAPVWTVKYSSNGKIIASGGETGILAIHSIK